MGLGGDLEKEMVMRFGKQLVSKIKAVAGQVLANFRKIKMKIFLSKT